MALLGRQDFLDRSTNRQFWDIPLPGGDHVRARSLTAGEARKLRRLFRDKEGTFDADRGDMYNELLIGACLCNGGDALLFTTEEVLAGALDEIDTRTLIPLGRRLRELTGFSADYDWLALEDAAKNSSETVTPDSSGD